MGISLRYLSYLAVILILLQLTAFICVEKQYWFHPESIGTFAKVHNTALADLDIKGMVLSGKDIDPNGARFRPISHAAELIDAKLRMPLANLVGPNPTFNSLSILLFVCLSVVFVYKIFAQWTRDRWLTAALTLLSVCSIAFLSNTVLLFRPAKRMAILFSVITLYILSRFIVNHDNKKLPVAYALMWGILLSDEEGIFLACMFVTMFSVPLIVNKEDPKRFRTLAIWLTANTIALAFICLKTIWSASPSFNDTTLNVSIMHELSMFLNATLANNTILLMKTIYTGAFGFAQPSWINIGLALVMATSLILIYKKYGTYKTNINTLPTIMYCTASLLSFIYFPVFNALLQQIGGSTVMRSISYYYGSSTFIGQMLIIMALLSARHVFFANSKFNNQANVLLILIVCLMIPYNLSTFRSTNQLIEALHNAPRYGSQINAILEYNWNHRDTNILSLNEVPLMVMQRDKEAALLANNVFGEKIAPQTYGLLYDINKFGATGTVTPQYAVEMLVKTMNFSKKQSS